MYHLKGGHGRYLRELIANLEQIDSTNRYTIILHPEGASSYTPTNPNFKIISTDTHWYTLREQTKFLRLLNKTKADLVHFPHWNVPLGYRKPFVVTIHDLILLEHPTSAASTRNPLFYWIKYLAFRTILKSTINRAKHIITVSNFAKTQIKEHFPYLETPITTIHNSANVIASGAKKSRECRSDLLIRDCFVPRNDKPYLLYTGVAFPHKNLHFLLHAFHQFNIRYGRTHKLVLAGKKNKFYEKLLKSNTALTMLEWGDLIFIDGPTDTELESLYKNTKAVICPSLMEGFGLPPLEAATRGIPAICSNIPAHREIMEDNVSYFNPTNIETLISSLHRVTTDNDYHYFLSQKAKNRTKNFSWKKSAEETLNVILNEAGLSSS